MSENIDFFLDEDNTENNIENDFDINDILNQVQNTELFENDLSMPYFINYSENFTVKQLLLICDYYGISKELKTNKATKDIIIQILIDFEMNPINNYIVFKRQNMWFYMNELKNDKFMKKYVLW